jgi:serine/threonine protein kinase
LCLVGQNLLAGTHLARQAAGANGEWCSLELLRPELAQDAELRESFLSDARRAIGLVDTRLVGTRALVCDDEALGRTTEWVDGQPLSRVLERVGRAHFPLRVQLWIICEILAALEAAEQLGAAADPPGAFVHGALSADSVLLTYDGQIRLLGVGFAATLRLLEQRLAQLVLEPGYVPPERYVGSDPTPSADLYAAGALLWEALAQMDRGLASSLVDVCRPRESDETPSAEEICPQAPERLKRICDRALAFNPSDRYPNASALRTELEGFLSDTRPEGESEQNSATLAELLIEHFAAERTTLQSLIELHTARLHVAPKVVEAYGEGVESPDASAPAHGVSSPAPDARGPTLTRFTGEGAEDGTFTVTSSEEESRVPAPPAQVSPGIVRDPSDPPAVLPDSPAVRVPEPHGLTPGSVQRLDPELLSSARHQGSAREQAPMVEPAPRRFASELRRLSGTALGVAGILALFAFAFYGVPRVHEPEAKVPVPPAAPVVRSALLPAPPRNSLSNLSLSNPEPKKAEAGISTDAGASREGRPAATEAASDVAPLVPARDSARAPAPAKVAPPPRAAAAVNEPRWKTQFKKILRSAAPHPSAPVEPLPIDEADPYSR